MIEIGKFARYTGFLLRLLLCILVLVGVVSRPLAAAEPPSTHGLGVALVDVRTGQVLHERYGDRVLPMASTTKIMTALLAVERASLTDIVTIPPEAATIHGSRIYLEAGETYTLEDLLYALMIASANDAAIAIAHHISGSVPAFAELMTERAREMGLTNTVFRNPHGLDEDGHVTTAVELGRLAAHALRNPLFRRFSEATNAVIPYPVKDSVRELNSYNYFLVSYPGATGVKTGWTTRAGHCLVSSAVRDDQEVVGVILGASNRDGIWREMSALITYGLDEFEAVPIIQPGTRIDLSSHLGLEGLVGVTQEPVFSVKNRDGGFSLGSRVEIVPVNLTDPIEPGDLVGYLEVFEGDTMVGTSLLVSADRVPLSGGAAVSSLWPGSAWVLLGGAIVFAVYRSSRRRRRMRRVLYSKPVFMTPGVEKRIRETWGSKKPRYVNRRY